MKVRDVAGQINKLIPLKLAQSWDNVGLLVGDESKNVKNILLTIDVTGGVVAEARKLKTDLIISYHPVIWDGLKTVTAAGPSSVVYDLIRWGIAVFTVHTALDAAMGGINDGLAEIVGIQNGQPIGDFVEAPDGESYKLVVFVPVEAANKVANVVFSAGAGAIGSYSHCGFSTKGQGSFLPLEGARPAVGKKGRLEKVEEVRFETIVPADRLDVCIAAMKKAHPYEVPAYDCFELYNDRAKFGLGRIGKLTKPVSVTRIIQSVKRATGAQVIGIVGPQRRIVKTAAVCAGSCGKIINSVIAAGADLYLTGELKHHQALAAQESGLTCLCLSHTVSERFILKRFVRSLQRELRSLTIKISKTDADPFKWKKL